MALEEYRRKRDFSKSPEPRGGRVRVRPTPARGSHCGYLIQKHEATRLHYDFRLELDGVLLSWAVTKGPSLNPADKRLAVRTEDHPLSYGGFEGTIPQGEYGGGTVMLWDTGTWEPLGDAHEGLEKGRLSFVLHGERLKGKWNLVRMPGDRKRENWLLIKGDDEQARKDANRDFLDKLGSSVKTGRSMEEIAGGRGKDLDSLVRRYPEVQLATLVASPPEGNDWVHEVKFDGYRLLGFISEHVSRLRTRNGKDWTASFPSLTSALEKLKVKDAVLDMEAVVLDAKGKSHFQSLQTALGDGGNAEGVVAYVFDLLYQDGQDLSRLPLIERKDKLKKLLGSSRKRGALRLSEHVAGQGAKFFAKACKTGLEGIISKVANGPYVSGRQKSWLKVKCSQRQEFVIAGYSDARKGERAIGALYLGYKKGGVLKYAGKVGTGFTMKSARELAQRLEGIKGKNPVFSRDETSGLPAGEWRAVHWTRPELLCEVAFTEWTADGRIRHPSFQGLREDKEANDVQQEIPQAGNLVIGDIAITHPDRVISKTGDITKGELAEYFAGVAGLMLPHIARRPLSLLRCPSGIDGGCFFQRNPGQGLGADIHAFKFGNKGERHEYLYLEDEKGLLEAIQMNTVEIHPWAATIDAIDYPDRMIFDLDPAPELPFDAVKLAARDLRQRLRRRGLASVVKCTGGKGLHVTVPLAAKNKFPEVKAFAASIADEMVAGAPKAYVATMSKAKRSGKLFIDYFRNDYTATAIADYSVRARPGAPVAMPVEWDELKKLKSGSEFAMKGVLKRIRRKGWSPPERPRGQVLP